MGFSLGFDFPEFTNEYLKQILHGNVTMKAFEKIEASNKTNYN